MRTSATAPLRVLIVIFGLLSLLIQFFAIPSLAREVTQYAPEFTYLIVPYTVPAFLAFACVEAVLVSMWVLLGLVASGNVFSAKSFRWVNVIIWSTWIAVALALIPVVIMTAVPGSGAPAPFLLMIIITLGGVAFALLMTVMRALLRQATEARAELEEVI